MRPTTRRALVVASCVGFVLWVVVMTLAVLP
jgi:hypothetical protein